MGATLLEPAAKRFPKEYPFHIGTRLVNHRDAEGKIVGHEYVPLTEEDYLHPQEEDRFLSTNRHAVALRTLGNALTLAAADQPGRRVFLDHRIDWQRSDIEPHGPDGAVFDGVTADYDDASGTFPVEDYGAKIVAIFEITSESTRHIDFGKKFDEFLELGIPYFIMIDAAAPNGVPAMIGFRYVRGVYREMRHDAKLGIQVPQLKLWFRWQKDKFIIADEDGKDIPDFDELSAQAEAEKSRANAEKTRANAEKSRANAEKSRANAEKTRADAEKFRADALARELEELKAKLNEND